MKITVEIESLEKHPGWYKFELQKPGEVHRSPMTTLDSVISDIRAALLQSESTKEGRG